MCVAGLAQTVRASARDGELTVCVSTRSTLRYLIPRAATAFLFTAAHLGILLRSVCCSTRYPSTSWRAPTPSPSRRPRPRTRSLPPCHLAHQLEHGRLPRSQRRLQVLQRSVVASEAHLKMLRCQHQSAKLNPGRHQPSQRSHQPKVVVVLQRLLLLPKAMVVMVKLKVRRARKQRLHAGLLGLMCVLD